MRSSTILVPLSVFIIIAAMTTTISDSSDMRKAQHLPPRTASVSAYPDYTAVFTDGSLVQDSTGSAFIHDDQVFSYRLHSFNSVFTAELCAMYRALLFIRCQPRQYHLVCTDSLSGLQSLCGCSPDNPIVIELLFQLFHIHRAGKSVVFCRIPGQSGLPGNEAADAAAKAAAFRGYWQSLF
jgi:ribonuclease HI